MAYANNCHRISFVRFISSGMLILEAAIGAAFITEAIGTMPGISPSHSAQAQDGASADVIYRKVAPAVAYIRAEQNNGYSTGSGVIIDTNGLIVTNAHVIEGSEKVTVELHDGRKFEAKVISRGHGECLDLAILKIEGTNLPKVSFSKLDSIQKGERVFAIGYPKGIKPSAITQGIVSNVYTDPGMIQTDTTLIPGNSGGALLNDHGELVGINTLKGMDDQTGMNFAITSDKVQDLLMALKQGASPAIGQYIIPPHLQTNVSLVQSLSLGGDPVSDRLRSTSNQICGDRSRVNLYTFQGKAYQPVMLSMTSSEIGSYMILLGPNGEKVASSGASDRNKVARILQTLPASGTYTLLANAANPEETGRYQLQASLPLLVGSGVLDQNTETCFDDNSPCRRYLFTGKAGQNITLVYNFEFEPFLALVDADGKVVTKGKADRQGHVDVKLPRDGSYRLIISTVNPSERGTFSISIHTKDDIVGTKLLAQRP